MPLYWPQSSQKKLLQSDFYGVRYNKRLSTTGLLWGHTTPISCYLNDSGNKMKKLCATKKAASYHGIFCQASSP